MKNGIMQEVDVATLRRFLRAHDLDIEKDSAMLIKYMAWRRKFVPRGSISASEAPNHIAHNKVFMQGTDKRGCPVAPVFGAKHFPSKGTYEELKNYPERLKKLFFVHVSYVFMTSWKIVYPFVDKNVWCIKIITFTSFRLVGGERTMILEMRSRLY